MSLIEEEEEEEELKKSSNTRGDLTRDSKENEELLHEHQEDIQEEDIPETQEIHEEIIQEIPKRDVLSNFGGSLYSMVSALEVEQDNESLNGMTTGGNGGGIGGVGVGVGGGVGIGGIGGGSGDKRNSSDIIANVVKPIREMMHKAFRRSDNEAVQDVMSHMHQMLVSQTNRPLGHSQKNESEFNESIMSDLLVRCLAHYICMSVPPSWLDQMCRQMLDRIEMSIRQFLNFKQYFACHFSSDDKRARLFVLQCALHRRFPLLASEGCSSLTRIPVFYGTKACSLFKALSSDERHRWRCNERTRVSWELLQTNASFKTIPSRHKETEEPLPVLTMDVKTLEQEIERDQSKGKLPCVVMCTHMDNLERVRKICDRHGLWLHVEGGSNSLLLAASSSLPNSTRVMMTHADSISCQPFEWFHFSNERHRPIHRNGGNANGNSDAGIGNMSISPQESEEYIEMEMELWERPRFSTTLTFIRDDLRDTSPPLFGFSDADFTQIFPLWHLLVTSMGSIKSRVDHALALCAHLKTQLSEHKNMFSTPMGPGPSLPHILWFQTVPNPSEVNLNALGLDINGFHQYLITWCAHEMAQLNITRKVYQDQTCFCFDPLASSQLETIEMDFISQYVQKILVQMNVLRQCLLLRRNFQELLRTHPELHWVDPSLVNGFIGLGAFRFVPPYFSDPSSPCVTILNTQLRDDLAKKSSAPNMYRLCLDHHEYPVICVNPNTRIFEERSVNIIFEEIVSTLKTMKFPEEVISEMGQAIKQGIESAKTQVQEEAAGDYHPDTIIRKIPVFGSIYGWILPSQKAEQGNTGISFDMISRDIKRTTFSHSPDQQPYDSDNGSSIIKSAANDDTATPTDTINSEKEKETIIQSQNVNQDPQKN